MGIVMHVAVVEKSDYTQLAPLCIDSIICHNYTAFLEQIEKYCEELKTTGITPIKTYIDPAALKVYLRGGIATRADLARYAAIVAKS